jgi:NhaP-type Na+/H+ or K+/H+ antiporter
VDFVLQILLNFAYLFFFSLLLGVVFGLLLSLVFKRIESFSRQPIK